MKKAVFAGSFDPFTLGHKDIVLRATSLFDKVIVAVADHTGKNSNALEIRKKIVEQSLEDVANVSITQFSGLLTDFMRKLDVDVLVRGVRSAADYDYERSLMEVYRSLNPNIEFVLLPAKAELAHISSSVVRELCKMNGNLGGYVDTKAEKYLKGFYME